MVTKIASEEIAYLECHQKTFAFHVGETEVNTSWVARLSAVANDMSDLSIDAVDQSVC